MAHTGNDSTSHQINAGPVSPRLGPPPLGASPPPTPHLPTPICPPPTPGSRGLSCRWFFQFVSPTLQTPRTASSGIYLGT